MHYTNDEVLEFLGTVNKELSQVYTKMMNSLWLILTDNDPELIEKFEKYETEYQTYLSSENILNKLNLFLLSPGIHFQNKRQLIVLFNEMLEYQTSPEKLKKISVLWNKLHSEISRFRAIVEGKEYSESETLQVLKTSKDTKLRENHWRSYMHIGSKVQFDLIELVQLRNKIAHENGFRNYFELKLHTQELNTKFITDLIKEIRSNLDSIYLKEKERIDLTLSQIYKVRIDHLQPWHYDHPFFQYVKQSTPHYKSTDLRKLIERATLWFKERNMGMEHILSAADLYYRREKTQANFCLNIDRNSDIRLSCNIDPTNPDIIQIKILLHELGHAFYEKEIEHSLPFILKQPYIFISEAVALLFENISVQIFNSQIEGENSAGYSYSSLNNLIRLYWTITVVEFERLLYENPLQDLNDLWWSLVEEIQRINRPSGWENIFSWAAKPHLTTLPVYYHNYLLGDIIATQFENNLNDLFGSWYSVEAIDYLKKSILRPGKSKKWEEIILAFNSVGFNTVNFIDRIRKSMDR